MKTYYNIYFKGTAMDSVSMPEDKYLKVRDDIVNQAETLIEFNDQTFRPRDVRYVKRVSRGEIVPDQESYPEITEEKRQDNLNRFAVLKELFFGPGRFKHEWVNPYNDPIRSTMTQEELRAFDKEHFDVYFESHEAKEQAIAKWLPEYRRQQRLNVEDFR